MARWSRLVATEFPLHVTHRGHNRETVFHDEHDFARYREILLSSSARAGCEIHAYALMTNHVHLLLSTDTRLGAAQLFRRIGSTFVRYWNKRHRRSGTLWDGRFRSSVVDTDAYFLACCRYIDHNPVRAGMVEDPACYGWSSYRRLACGHDDRLVTPHAAYLALGTTSHERETAYREYCDWSEQGAAIRVIRHATRGGAAAGSSQFHARLETIVQKPTFRLLHGGARRGQYWRASPVAPTLAPQPPR